MRSRSLAAQGSEVALHPRIIERGVELLHAQCWLWGQDLRALSGNILLAAGLERGAFEGARSHQTYYGAWLEGGRFVVAWSGGLLFGASDGALFFPRLRFAPVVLAVRSLDELPDLNAIRTDGAEMLTPGSVTLVRAAADWLADYEDTVQRVAGSRWRFECARRWREIEEGARDAAASVGVQYVPLAPLPETGLARGWREFGATLSSAASDQPQG